MNKMKSILSILLAIGFFATVLTSCDDDEPAELKLSTLTAGSSDLNGATSASDVAADADIVATFSTNIDPATATDANITLTRDYNGAAVAKTISVSGNTVTISPDQDFFAGDQYTLSFGAGLKSTEGKFLTALDRKFSTPGIGIGSVPQASNQTLYIQFGNSIADLAGNATVASQQVAFTTDRFGNANAAVDFRGATAAGNGDLVELASDNASTFISPSMTFSVWFKINPADYVAPGNKPMFGFAAEKGYFFEVGDGAAGPNWVKFTTNHKVDPDPKGHGLANSWGDFGKTDDDKDVVTLMNGNWHQLVMTYNNATYEKTIYLDGNKLKTLKLQDNTEWNLKDMTLTNTAGVDAKLALGYFASKANTATDWAKFSTADKTFKGAMDDLRIWKSALTATEVTALYNAEKAQ